MDLFAFPTEIRNIIINNCIDDNSGFFTFKILSHVCKNMRQEVASIVYYELPVVDRQFNYQDLVIGIKTKSIELVRFCLDLTPYPISSDNRLHTYPVTAAAETNAEIYGLVIDHRWPSHDYKWNATCRAYDTIGRTCDIKFMKHVYNRETNVDEKYVIREMFLGVFYKSDPMTCELTVTNPELYDYIGSSSFIN
jgi:hypothetical protein